MAKITLSSNKRRNYPGEISLWCGILGFISGIFVITYQTKYHESFFTDKTVLFFLNIFGNLWLIFTFLGLLSWVISLFLFLLVWKRRFRATGTILGILLPAIRKRPVGCWKSSV